MRSETPVLTAEQVEDLRFRIGRGEIVGHLNRLCDSHLELLLRDAAVGRGETPEPLRCRDCGAEVSHVAKDATECPSCSSSFPDAQVSAVGRGVETTPLTEPSNEAIAYALARLLDEFEEKYGEDGDIGLIEVRRWIETRQVHWPHWTWTPKPRAVETREALAQRLGKPIKVAEIWQSDPNSLDASPFVRLNGVPVVTYNCDCLNAASDGSGRVAPEGDPGYSAQRWVLLFDDVMSALAEPAATVPARAEGTDLGPHPDCPKCHGTGECDNAQFRCACRWSTSPARPV